MLLITRLPRAVRFGKGFAHHGCPGAAAAAAVGRSGAGGGDGLGWCAAELGKGVGQFFLQGLQLQDMGVDLRHFGLKLHLNIGAPEFALG